GAECAPCTTTRISWMGRRRRSQALGEDTPMSDRSLRAGAREAQQVGGRYAIHDAIGSGGMATVYIGRRITATGSAATVAIKRLHPFLAGDPEFVAGLLDEGRVASRIA